jgi:hypothetical protein
MKNRAIGLVLLFVLVNTVNSGTFCAMEEMLLVACAPGHPGSTSQAQPSMDALASGIVEAAGWPAGSLSAVYHEKETPGLDALGAATLALVPLPFFLKHRETLDLEPLLEVEQLSAAEGSWTLVAARGAVDSPAALDGWTVRGAPGYAPGFVRTIALGDWGELPESTEIRFSRRVLGDLREAAAGEPVAVLLDQAQAAALDQLPFGEKLEVVTRSGPMAGHLLCAVGGRFPAGRIGPLRAALLGIAASDNGRELLESLRIERFRELNEEMLERQQSQYAAAKSDAR